VKRIEREKTTLMRFGKRSLQGTPSVAFRTPRQSEVLALARNATEGVLYSEGFEPR
jgi:hypothetical protein